MAFVALTVLLAATLSSGLILPLRPIRPFFPIGGISPAHSILRLQATNAAARLGLAAQAQAGVLAAAGAQQTAAAHAAAQVAQNAAAASERFAANAARLSGSGAGASSTAVSSVTHSNPNGVTLLAPGEQITIPINYLSGHVQGYQHNKARGSRYGPDPAGPVPYGPGSVEPGFTHEPGYGPVSAGPGLTHEPVYEPGYAHEPVYEPGYAHQPAYGPGSVEPVYGPLQSPMPSSAGISGNTVGQNMVTLGAGTVNQPQPSIVTNQITGGQQSAYIPQGNHIATAQSTQQQTVAQQTNAIVKDPSPTTYINPLPGGTRTINDPFAANSGGGNAQMVTVNMVDPGVGNSITTGTTTNFQPMPTSITGPAYVDPAGPGISSYIGSMSAAGTGGAAALPVGAGGAAALPAGAGSISFPDPALTNAGSGGVFADPGTLSAGAGAISFVGSQNSAGSGGVFADPGTLSAGAGSTPFVGSQNSAGSGGVFADPGTLSAGAGAISFVGSQNSAGSGGVFADPGTLSAGAGSTPFVGSQNIAGSAATPFIATNTAGQAGSFIGV